MGVLEFVDVIIVVLLSMLASIFSLSTVPASLDGDMSCPPPPAKNLTHFFFRLIKKREEKKLLGLTDDKLYFSLKKCN